MLETSLAFRSSNKMFPAMDAGGAVSRGAAVGDVLHGDSFGGNPWDPIRRMSSVDLGRALRDVETRISGLRSDLLRTSAATGAVLQMDHGNRPSSSSQLSDLPQPD